VACRHNLAVDAYQHGNGRRPYTIRENESALEGVTPSCSLDVADAGPATHDAIGRMMGVTRQRIQALEVQALERLRRRVLAITDERFALWLELLTERP